MTSASIAQLDDDFARLPPCDIQAEQWCLGGLMWSQDAMTEVAELLEPDDFYRPAHQMIYLAMITLYAQGIQPDPIVLRAELDQRGELGRTGGAPYLAELYHVANVVSSQTLLHAKHIREKAARRKVLEAGTRLVQLAYLPDHDLATLVMDAQHEISQAVHTAGTLRNAARELLTAEAYCALPQEANPVLIPGMLHRQDRMIVVAGEGVGKSMLAWQVAFASAAGVHPFAWEPMTPLSVLICDFEIPGYEVRDRLRKFGRIAERSPAWVRGAVQVHHVPEGIDLSEASHQMRLAEVIRRAQPDLVIAGPVYKMIQDRGQGADQLHSNVTRFWDMIRARYGPALWLETHAAKAGSDGKRDLTPKGWQGYAAWPEFGKTIAPARKRGEWTLGQFRGDRIAGRAWPLRLTRNPNPNGWPWEGIYPDGTFDVPLPEGEDQ